MTYEEQLLTEDWKALRAKVLDRDKYNCTQCNNQKYLTNDSELRIGFIESTSTKMYGFIVLDINTFEHNKMICKISNEQNDKIISPSFLYFTINDKKWINVIACRHLTSLEKYNYIDAPKLELVEYNLKKIQGKKLDINSLFNNFHIEDNSPELKKLLNPIVAEIKESWTSFEWHYTKGLHIHHNYYQIGKLAWEYPLNAFTTLCWNCHETLHKDCEIEIRDINGNILDYKEVCPRCHGAGWFPEYKHVDNGICFECGGNKFKGNVFN